MIDINKQYTYKGQPARIYADGSDTTYGGIHGAYLTENKTWFVNTFVESDLVEVWQPKEGELIWDTYNFALGRVTYTDRITTSYIDVLERLAMSTSEFSTCSTEHCVPFIGTLPEAFKGL